MARARSTIDNDPSAISSQGTRRITVHPFPATSNPLSTTAIVPNVGEPSASHHAESGVAPQSSFRRGRGRPKGSKNRPKPAKPAGSPTVVTRLRARAAISALLHMMYKRGAVDALIRPGPQLSAPVRDPLLRALALSAYKRGAQDTFRKVMAQRCAAASAQNSVARNGTNAGPAVRPVVALVPEIQRARVMNPDADDSQNKRDGAGSLVLAWVQQQRRIHLETIRQKRLHHERLGQERARQDLLRQLIYSRKLMASCR